MSLISLSLVSTRKRGDYFFIVFQRFLLYPLPMKLADNQRENLGKYFFDLSKIVAGIYVFASLPDKPALFVLGLIIALIFLMVGLILTRG